MDSDNIKLYNQDCLITLKTIPNDSIDFILCDLPYGNTKCKWDCPIDLDALWIEYKRIIKKPQGVIALFGQQPFTSKLISSNFDWYKYSWIWKKNKTTRYLLANYRPMKCTEDICIFSPGGANGSSKKAGVAMNYFPQGLIEVNLPKKNSQKRLGKMLNQVHHLGPNNKLLTNQEFTQKYTNYPTEILNFNIENDTKHETQKPLDLIEYLIQTYTKENDLVLDNAMGSGTTGVGCKKLKRRFIGIELKKEFFDLASDRILSEISNK